MLTRRCAAFVTLFFLAANASAAEKPLVMWYAQPAGRTILNEGLPIGNGRIGALVGGGVAEEALPLNEDSLWTGNSNPTGSDTAPGMGAYQALGTLRLSLPGHAAAEGTYKRTLDLSTATATTSYRSGGITYARRYFASAPDDVIVIALTADKPGAYTGTLAFADGHNSPSLSNDDGHITSAGSFSNALKFETQVRVLHHGGKVSASNDGVQFEGCDSLTILAGARTNYVFDSAQKYVSGEPHAKLTQVLDAASNKSAETLLAAHVADYKKLFDRCQLDLGSSTPEQTALPTDKRVAAYLNAKSDPEYENLFFQYGRYLLIASSRGGMPANLQGLWNNSNTPPWHSDYHTNINIQMNYWPAEVTNLSETALPLFDFVESQLPDWRATAKTDRELARALGPTTRGWTVRTSANPFGGEGYTWNNTSNAWLAQHFWEHYAFTQDRIFLEKRAYPLLKECCQFWEDHLKAGPDGQLVVPSGWSPEHGPRNVDGVTYDQELVWDLFTNYLDAQKVLGIDADYAAKVSTMRDKLLKPRIGSWGQLMEWMTELTGQASSDGPLDTPDDHHRHVSHLFAVFPGRQISVATTPELAAAAKKSLEARGDFSTGWAMAWRISFWARLRDGDHGYKLLHNLLAAVGTTGRGSGGLYPNMFDAHPPFQIDGNFGGTAGMAEMLLQSQTGVIELLPALPAAWPEGSAKGLKARGNVTVDMRWAGGRLKDVTLTSPTAGICTIAYGTSEKTMTLKAGSPVTIEASGIDAKSGG
ncbi:MAG TPA: glycoside hydrolase family 95 protein [Phycisphaerae bacterium]|nr:glycoside hydrolase family 95 protein [Phycisphaerae bacterium]